MKKHLYDMTEPELKENLRQAMRWLENHLPAGDGPRGQCMFVLLCGTFDAGVAQYAANGDRENMIKFLRESADRLESRQDVPR